MGVPTLLRVSWAYLYNLLFGCCRNISDTRARIVPSLFACTVTITYSITPDAVHRQTAEKVFRNHSHLWSCMEKGELAFWKALCAIAQHFHHNSPTTQVRQCHVPSSTSPSVLTYLRQLSSTISPLHQHLLHLQLISCGCCTVCPVVIHVA
jgi:hypothetical protein